MVHFLRKPDWKIRLSASGSADTLQATAMTSRARESHTPHLKEHFELRSKSRSL